MELRRSTLPHRLNANATTQFPDYLGVLTENPLYNKDKNEKELKSTVYRYSFPEDTPIPKQADDCIFIPCMALNSHVIFFLVDFKTKTIVAIETDLSEEMTRLRNEIEKCHIDSKSPHRMSFDTLMYSIFTPHQGEHENQTVTVSFTSVDFFILIDLSTMKTYRVSDENKKEVWAFSSTNQIKDGKMYTSRWRFKDMYKQDITLNESVDLEILYYDIEEDKFHLIDTIEGIDHIHTTNISPDSRFLLLVQMTMDSILDSPNLAEESKERQREIQQAGLVNGNCYIYDLNAKKVTSMESVPFSPAHAEFESNNSEYFYLSQHNLCVMGQNNSLYSFGPATISKYCLTEDGKMERILQFQDAETVRAPGHVLFSYEGKQLMVIPSPPLQIAIVDRDTMSIHQKIQLSTKINKPDFSEGPYLHPIPLRDRTPFSVHGKNESRYLYHNNTISIGIYDFVTDTAVCDFKYNPGLRIMSVGHSSKFVDVQLHTQSTKTFTEMKKSIRDMQKQSNKKLGR